MAVKDIPTRYPGIYKRGNRYSVRFRDPITGKNRRQSCLTLKDALAFQAENNNRIHTNTWTRPQDRNQPVREWGEHWVSAKRGVWTKGTLDRHRSALRRHIYPHPRLGARKLSEVVASDVSEFFNDLADAGLAASTICKIGETLSGLFGMAVSNGYLTKAPTTNADWPVVIGSRTKALSQEQILLIAASLPERYRALVYLAAGTGLRISEALGLTWDRISTAPGNAEITVDRQWRSAGEGTFAKPKTKRGSRTIPLSDQLVSELLAHRASFGLGTSTHRAERGHGPLGGSGHVFTEEDGRPLRHSTFYAMWSTAVAGLGLDVEQGHNRFHSLRHFFASRLIEAGKKAPQICEYMGHSNPNVTYRVYAQWFDKASNDRDVRDIMTFTPADVTEGVAA